MFLYGQSDEAREPAGTEHQVRSGLRSCQSAQPQFQLEAQDRPQSARLRRNHLLEAWPGHRRAARSQQDQVSSFLPFLVSMAFFVVCDVLKGDRSGYHNAI